MENTFVANFQARIGNENIVETLSNDKKIGGRFCRKFIQALEVSCDPDLKDQSPYWHIYLSILAVYIHLNPYDSIEQNKIRAVGLFERKFKLKEIEYLPGKFAEISTLTYMELCAINTRHSGHAVLLAAKLGESKKLKKIYSES